MTDDSAWPLVQEWLADASNEHRLVEATDEAGEATLSSLEGVTEWSVLGALARNAAVVVVQDWLHVLGAGGGGYLGLREFNADEDAPQGALTVGVDLLGGSFTIQGGGLPAGEPGEVCYLAPDNPEWMPCEMGHSAFVRWALSGALDRFYADLRWDGWREAAGALGPDQGIAVYPLLWSEQARSGVRRANVPLLEVWRVLMSTHRQISAQG